MEKSPSQKKWDQQRKEKHLASKDRYKKEKVLDSEKESKLVKSKETNEEFLNNLLNTKSIAAKLIPFKVDIKSKHKGKQEKEESTNEKDDQVKDTWKCIYDCEFVGESEELMHTHLFRQHWLPSVSPGHKYTHWRRGKPTLMSASSRAI